MPRMKAQHSEFTAGTHSQSAAAILSPKAQETAFAIAPFALSWKSKHWHTAAVLPYTRISAQTFLLLMLCIPICRLQRQCDQEMVLCLQDFEHTF